MSPSPVVFSACGSLRARACVGVCVCDVMSRLLIPALLCGVCVCVCAVQQRDYGVKLCGREFIRAVIFTCGGSRWRRAVDLELPGLDPNLLLSYQSSSDEGGEQLSWMKSGDTDPDKPSSILSSSSSSLTDLLQAMGDRRNTRDESSLSAEVQRSWLESLYSSKPLGGGQVKSLDLGWLREDRRRRNHSLGLAGLCCNQGCTKNDIGLLC
ncbi:prorelaxin H1 [Clarias gariepinus]|uniref:prorelaxin H1 n=1 Tax=Clarias gariepinus TaxID=13013 RepID=UPI00234DF5CC|nr:prorelaxin H1 [Clarias gariepinus]